MREYMQIGLQYSIESLSIVDKTRERRRRRRGRSVHSIPIKKSTIKRRREEEEKK
jgi:hypothetical protein